MRLQTWMWAGMSLALAACGGGGDASSSAGGAPPASTSHVAITLVGPIAAVPSGSNFVFDVVVTNSGLQAATHVAASAQLGGGLYTLVVKCSAVSGATCPSDPSSLSVASLPAGASLHFQITAEVAPLSSGRTVSSFSVTADDEVPRVDSSAQWVVNAYTADLMVSGTRPGVVVASGGTAVYAMTVGNAGPDTASNVSIENAVDARQTLTSMGCTAAGGAVCPAVLGPTMTIPTLPKDGSVSFTIAAQVTGNPIGFVSNTLHVGPAGDFSPTNNVATVAADTVVDASPGAPSFVALRSDPGDFIGGGASYGYSNTDSVLTLNATGGQLEVTVAGEESWHGSFALPSGVATLQPGTYLNLTRFPFHSAATGGLDWSGDLGGCNTSADQLTIDSVGYIGGVLAAIDLRFEQHCEGAAPALRGQIHWSASDTSHPPGPVSPPPATLWRAPADATPTSGNYVYLQSDLGDYIDNGKTSTYVPANATMSVGVGVQSSLLVDVAAGGKRWLGSFQVMNSIAQLQPGYYGGLKRFPFHNPARGGLDWFGDGRGCNMLTGWFVIDSVSYVAGAISAIDLRFEQHCEGAAPALHGQIHWIN